MAEGRTGAERGRSEGGRQDHGEPTWRCAGRDRRRGGQVAVKVAGARRPPRGRSPGRSEAQDELRVLGHPVGTGG
jgi:hypothetical protein